jgi:hypothetical protein
MSGRRAVAGDGRGQSPADSSDPGGGIRGGDGAAHGAAGASAIRQCDIEVGDVAIIGNSAKLGFLHEYEAVCRRIMGDKMKFEIPSIYLAVDASLPLSDGLIKSVFKTSVCDFSRENPLVELCNLGGDLGNFNGRQCFVLSSTFNDGLIAAGGRIVVVLAAEEGRTVGDEYLTVFAYQVKRIARSQAIHRSLRAVEKDSEGMICNIRYRLEVARDKFRSLNPLPQSASGTDHVNEDTDVLACQIADFRCLLHRCADSFMCHLSGLPHIRMISISDHRPFRPFLRQFNTGDKVYCRPLDPFTCMPAVLPIDPASPSQMKINQRGAGSSYNWRIGRIVHESNIVESTLLNASLVQIKLLKSPDSVFTFMDRKDIAPLNTFHEASYVLSVGDFCKLRFPMDTQYNGAIALICDHDANDNFVVFVCGSGDSLLPAFDRSRCVVLTIRSSSAEVLLDFQGRPTTWMLRVKNENIYEMVFHMLSSYLVYLNIYSMDVSRRYLASEFSSIDFMPGDIVMERGQRHRLKWQVRGEILGRFHLETVYNGKSLTDIIKGSDLQKVSRIDTFRLETIGGEGLLERCTVYQLKCGDIFMLDPKIHAPCFSRVPGYFVSIHGQSGLSAYFPGLFFRAQFIDNCPLGFVRFQFPNSNKDVPAKTRIRLKNMSREYNHLNGEVACILLRNMIEGYIQGQDLVMYAAITRFADSGLIAVMPHQFDVIVGEHYDWVSMHNENVEEYVSLMQNARSSAQMGLIAQMFPDGVDLRFEDNVAPVRYESLSNQQLGIVKCLTRNIVKLTTSIAAFHKLVNKYFPSTFGCVYETDIERNRNLSLECEEANNYLPADGYSNDDEVFVTTCDEIYFAHSGAACKVHTVEGYYVHMDTEYHAGPARCIAHLDMLSHSSDLYRLGFQATNGSLVAYKDATGRRSYGIVTQCMNLVFNRDPTRKRRVKVEPSYELLSKHSGCIFHYQCFLYDMQVDMKQVLSALKFYSQARALAMKNLHESDLLKFHDMLSVFCELVNETARVTRSRVCRIVEPNTRDYHSHIDAFYNRPEYLHEYIAHTQLALEVLDQFTMLSNLIDDYEEEIEACCPTFVEGKIGLIYKCHCDFLRDTIVRLEARVFGHYLVSVHRRVPVFTGDYFGKTDYPGGDELEVPNRDLTLPELSRFRGEVKYHLVSGAHLFPVFNFRLRVLVNLDRLMQAIAPVARHEPAIVHPPAEPTLTQGQHKALKRKLKNARERWVNLRLDTLEDVFDECLRSAIDEVMEEEPDLVFNYALAVSCVDMEHSISLLESDVDDQVDILINSLSAQVRRAEHDMAYQIVSYFNESVIPELEREGADLVASITADFEGFITNLADDVVEAVMGNVIQERINDCLLRHVTFQSFSEAQHLADAAAGRNMEFLRAMIRAVIPQGSRPAFTDDAGRREMTDSDESDQYDQCYVCLNALNFMDPQVSAVSCVCASAQLICGVCRPGIVNAHQGNALGHAYNDDRVEFRRRRMEAIMLALTR